MSQRECVGASVTSACRLVCTVQERSVHADPHTHNTTLIIEKRKQIISPMCLTISLPAPSGGYTHWLARLHYEIHFEQAEVDEPLSVSLQTSLRGLSHTCHRETPCQHFTDGRYVGVLIFVAWLENKSAWRDSGGRGVSQAKKCVKGQLMNSSLIQGGEYVCR